jgi:putative transposase
MKVMKAFKFRLKTNITTSVKLAQIAGSNRFIWNWALANQKKRLENKEYTQNYASLCSSLLKIKNDEATAWLNESPSQTLQQTLKNLERALKDAFNKKSPKKFPRFKKKGQQDSFRYPQGIKVINNRVFLPKIGWVPFFKSRDIIGTIKNATVSKKGEHWFVSIHTEIETSKPVHSSKTAIGVDLGVKKFATLSDGRVYKAKHSFKKRQARLSKLQQHLSKKKKGSLNFKKLKKRITKLHTKIANIRQDYLHQVSTDISKNHALVVLEDLKVTNMSRSASGTLENPGKMVAAKSGLNRSILDQGWHSFKGMLSYKLNHLGGELLLVDPRHTSQRCSNCGHTEKDNRLSQAQFACLLCGHKENADINAAKNILAAGHAVLSLSPEVARAA